MGWHYALIRKKKEGAGKDYPSEYYAIHEVFRRTDNNKIWGMTTDPIDIGVEIWEDDGENIDPVKEAISVLETMKKDLENYPVLNEEDIPEDEPEWEKNTSS